MCSSRCSFSPSPTFSLPTIPPTNPSIYTPAPATTFFPAKNRLAATAKDVWTRGHPHQRRRYNRKSPFLDHSVDMDELLRSIGDTENEEELFSVLSVYKTRQLSMKFMASLLSREPDWQRSLAILDWIHDHARYTPAVFPYNVVLRNALRAAQWEIARGLFDEMRHRALAPDRYTYSTLITHFGKAGLFDDALAWLQQMEQDRVSGDLVLYSNLIELARKLRDYSKAVSIFSRLKRNGIAPDLVLFNTMINVYGKAGMFREARSLLSEMRSVGVSPDKVSYSTLLASYAENGKFVEALSVFSEMDSGPDLFSCNVMIDVYGQLGMAREADRLFWSMRKVGVEPSVVSYNTMLRVYGESGLVGEAIHLFRLMQRKDVAQNAVTYNTMINIYGDTGEHEKATSLVHEMRARGIAPDGITYSTIISIWARAGKLDRAALLFQKLRASKGEIDKVLYQTMIVAYERAGLVAHSKRLLHELRRPDNDDIPRETAVAILAGAGRVEEATWVFRQACAAGEVKDISVFSMLIGMYSRNKRYSNVVEAFGEMRRAGFFPGSGDVALVLNALGKLGEIGGAHALYAEMERHGCALSDQIHFQMLGLLGATKDFEAVDRLFEKLRSDPNVNKKELHFVVAGMYERANRLNDASRIMAHINHHT